MKLLGNSLRWSNLLLVVVTLLAYLAPLVNPSQIWIFAYFGLAYPILLFANIGFAVFWLLRKNRYALFSIGCIVVGLGHLGGFFNISSLEKASDPDSEMRILTFNIAALNNYSGKKGKREESIRNSFEQFAKQIEQPDVLCLQEWKGEKMSKLIENTLGLPQRFRFQSTAIFAKYPILKGGEFTFDESTNSCVWADLKTPKGVVRIYSLHLQSNKLTLTAEKIATQGQINDEETWRNVRFVLSRYRKAVAIRARQAQQIADHIAKSPHPVILCGDFNDPPVSYVYNLLSKNLQDSFCKKGSGTGTTFAGSIPFLRIDYVMPDGHFKVLRHKVIHSRISDHYPVQAAVQWTK